MIVTRRGMISSALGAGALAVPVTARSQIGVPFSWSIVPTVPPAFGSVGTIAGNATAQTAAICPVPAGLVAGNLLIAELQLMSANAAGTVGITAGWTVGDQTGAGTASAAWAWKISTGGEGNPTFNWTGGSSFHTKMIRITGNASAPIGTIAKAAGASGTALNVGGIVTTKAASYIYGIALAAGDTITPVTFATPASFTSRSAFNDQYGTDDLCDQTVSASGGTSTSLTTTLSRSTPWQGFLIEVKAA